MISISINNNPRCNCKLESTVKQQTWEFQNIPFIKIEGNNINSSIANIKVTQDDKIFFDKSIEITNNSFVIKIELKELLSETNNIKVAIDDYEEMFNINLNKIYGTVKYLDEKPVKNPIISCTNSGIVAVGDEEGRFELLLSDREESIGIFDNMYSDSTLETWLYNVDIEKDIEIDIKIDKCEIYGIRMWEQECSHYIHFIPMSITRVNDASKNGSNKELDIILHKDTWPNLDKEDVAVYYNNEIVEIVSFSQVGDFLGKINGKNIFRNGYIISIPKITKKENGLIKIVCKDKYLINNRLNIGVGEGYYLLN